MSNAGEPVIQCRRCGWRPRGGDVICESCNVLLAGPPDLGAAAGRGRRVAAALIDALVVAVPAIAGWLIWSGDVAEGVPLTDRQQVVLFAAILIPFSIWAAAVTVLVRRRQSLGKLLLQMRVVRIDGREMTAIHYLARQVGWWLMVSVGLWAWIGQVSEAGQLYGALVLALLLVDAGMLLLARSRQSVHDKIFRTIVVETDPPPVLPIAAQAGATLAAETDPSALTAEEPAAPLSEPAAAPEPAAPIAKSGPNEPEASAGAERSAERDGVQRELDELERVREYLTPAQYERRRRSILGEDADGER